jgi:hypothetical protein
VAVFVIAGDRRCDCCVCIHIFLSFHTAVRGDVPVIARPRQAAANLPPGTPLRQWLPQLWLGCQIL